MKGYIKILGFLKDYKRLFAFSVIAMFISSAFEGIQLSFLIPLTDRIFNNRPIVIPNKLPEPLVRLVDQLNAISPETLFWTLPFVAIVMIIVKNAFVFLYGYLMNDLSQQVLRDVRMKIYQKIQYLSLDYFSTKRTGELISRITNDVSLIENAVSYGITDLFTQTFLLISYVIIALVINFKAALVIFCILPWIIWPIAVLGRKIKKLTLGEQESMADISSILLETISGVKVIKAFCTEDQEIERFRQKNFYCYRVKMKSTVKTKLLVPISDAFGVLCGILVILGLGRQVMSGALSFGVFGVFLAAVLSIIRPIKKLGNVHAIMQRAISAQERIHEVLDEQPTVKEAAAPVDVAALREAITVEAVDFSYSREDEPVLHGIDLTIRRGELVAIVGPTGSGKTTLVNLIPRFYDPTRGRVLFDGHDLRDVSFKSLRSRIGIVLQENFLFNDTVRANIAYGRPGVTDAEIEAAAQRAYAHGFISDLPQGYATVIGERGFRLSGGEKQRIAIARAILSNPEILILDEATSSLDSESEQYIKEALDDLMKGRTVVAIAHRLSTVIQADKIVVIQDGRIVGMGRHEELLKAGGLYQRLYETQFEVSS